MTIGAMHKSLVQFSKNTNALLTENHKTTDPYMIKFMVYENLQFVPLDDDEKKEIDRLADSSSNFTTIHEAMDKLEHLAKMYDALIFSAEKVKNGARFCFLKLGLNKLN